MKKAAAALITMASLAPTAQADLLVYERQPNQSSTIHHGLANGVPVLIDIYGGDAITSAREYGRSLVGRHSFSESKELIQSRAEQLYHNHPAMVRWFEQDCAQAYDQKARDRR